jgi:hypothetical protein
LLLAEKAGGSLSPELPGHLFATPPVFFLLQVGYSIGRRFLVRAARSLFFELQRRPLVRYFELPAT